MGPLPRQVVQDPNRVVGHRGDRPEEWPAIAVANAQMIVVATSVVALQLVDLGSPNRAGHPEPHDEEDRRPLRAEDLV